MCWLIRWCCLWRTWSWLSGWWKCAFCPVLSWSERITAILRIRSLGLYRSCLTPRVLLTWLTISYAYVSRINHSPTGSWKHSATSRRSWKKSKWMGCWLGGKGFRIWRTKACSTKWASTWRTKASISSPPSRHWTFLLALASSKVCYWMSDFYMHYDVSINQLISIYKVQTVIRHPRFHLSSLAHNSCWLPPLWHRILHPCSFPMRWRRLAPPKSRTFGW